MLVVEKKLEELIEGDELSEDIFDVNGILILPDGKVLDERLIQALESRGVESIKVRAVVHLSEKDLEERRQEIINEIEHRFRNVQGNPLMKDLQVLITEHRLKNQ